MQVWTADVDRRRRLLLQVLQQTKNWGDSMRFQCLSCGKSFGWTAKKTVSKVIEGYDLPVTMEYIVCPYCESLDFEESNGKIKQKLKDTPPVQMPQPAKIPQFNPADLMEHKWKGKKIRQGQYKERTIADPYGWDFKNNFNPVTIEELSKGKLTIDKFDFELDGKLVKFQKAQR